MLYHGQDHQRPYTPYEGPNLANQKSRMLVVFDRKLEETTPYIIGILLDIREH